MAAESSGAARDADPFPDGLSMSALYRHLPQDARDQYDQALQEVLHTLDRMPRDELPEWVTDLHHELDREDIAIRKIKRDEQE